MTVCIAGLAENGKKAILIADKLLTTPGVLSYQSNVGEKIFKIYDNMYVLWAGGVVDATTILSRSEKILSLGTFGVKEVAECINQKHLEYLHEILVNTHIKGRGIKSIEDFYGNQSINLPIESRREIDNALATHNLTSGTVFIVCGKDSDGQYRIFFLDTNPRHQIIPIIESYVTIGSGAWHAKFSIIHSKYTPLLPINNVKKIFKEAKKKAEKDTNVGKKEDIIVME